jgi:hypothetical protein
VCDLSFELSERIFHHEMQYELCYLLYHFAYLARDKRNVKLFSHYNENSLVHTFGVLRPFNNFC